MKYRNQISARGSECIASGVCSQQCSRFPLTPFDSRVLLTFRKRASMLRSLHPPTRVTCASSARSPTFQHAGGAAPPAQPMPCVQNLILDASLSVGQRPAQLPAQRLIVAHAGFAGFGKAAKKPACPCGSGVPYSVGTCCCSKTCKLGTAPVCKHRNAMHT